MKIGELPLCDVTMGNCWVSDNTPSQVFLSPFNCFVLVPGKHVEGQVKNVLLVLAVNRGLNVYGISWMIERG